MFTNLKIVIADIFNCFFFKFSSDLSIMPISLDQYKIFFLERIIICQNLKNWRIFVVIHIFHNCEQNIFFLILKISVEYLCYTEQ